jgi:cytosine/uracil/thiamine/allantoin permease
MFWYGAQTYFASKAVALALRAVFGAGCPAVYVVMVVLLIGVRVQVGGDLVQGPPDRHRSAAARRRASCARAGLTLDVAGATT